MSVGQKHPVQLYGKDLVVGHTFGGAPHVIGDEQFNAFALLTGDNHPIHYDDAFAAKAFFGKRLAHGLLLASMTALGATPMSQQIEDAMIAFVDNGFKYLKPVFINETVTSHFEVVSVDQKPDRNMAFVRFGVHLTNQNGEKVLEGHHTYLLRLTAQ
jgi:3-hydroxybutyryl-CoA dehydratase